MYLTHVDADGNDSPAILIDNATAANRAVNIPEFVNIPPDGLQKIDTPALEFYRHFDRALQLAQKGDQAGAIGEWKQAVKISPDDATAQNNLGVALARLGKYDEAIPHYQRALEINPQDAKSENNLGVVLLQTGRFSEALPHFERALEIDHDFAEAHAGLGRALAATGKIDAGIFRFQRALELNPRLAEATRIWVALWPSPAAWMRRSRISSGPWRSIPISRTPTTTWGGR